MGNDEGANVADDGKADGDSGEVGSCPPPQKQQAVDISVCWQYSFPGVSYVSHVKVPTPQFPPGLRSAHTADAVGTDGGFDAVDDGKVDGAGMVAGSWPPPQKQQAVSISVC